MDEDSQEEGQEVEKDWKQQFTTVTPFSKYLALALVIALPFIGGWVGYTYAPVKIVKEVGTEQAVPNPVSDMQSPPIEVSSNGSTSIPSSQTVVVQKTVDTSNLPLGDGKRSTSPKKGYVYSCQTQFSDSAGGAQADGSWIHGTFWNLAEKIVVQGNVLWPNAWFKAVVSGISRLITGNGLPVDAHTGTFPVAKSDPAYQIDRNPNTITVQDVSYTLPANPTMAAQPSCVPMGAVGVMLNGVSLFNALDGRGDDAVAHEVQDSCNGHPEMSGEYHYHGPSDCVPGSEEPNKLIGYALDGFGIYSRFDKNGDEYSTADLDECHGIVSKVEWNGKMVNMYHYVMTQDYPYTIGCFRGTPVVSTSANAGPSGSLQQSSSPTAGGQGSGTPPQGAIDACSSKSSGVSCSFSTPQGTVSGTCRIPPNSTSLACVPG